MLRRGTYGRQVVCDVLRLDIQWHVVGVTGAIKTPSRVGGYRCEKRVKVRRRWAVPGNEFKSLAFRGL